MRRPADAPSVSSGGAAVSGAAGVAVWPTWPWHEVQVRLVSTTPLSWVASLTVESV
jgi:hypothetical protein